MKYEVKFTGQFKRDLKLARKQRKDMDKLFDVISTITEGDGRFFNDPFWAKKHKLFLREQSRPFD